MYICVYIQLYIHTYTHEYIYILCIIWYKLQTNPWLHATFTLMKPAGMPRHWWWWLIRLCWIRAWEKNTDSKDHGDSAQTWSNPGDPSLWWLNTFCVMKATVMASCHVRLVVSVRFSFHHGAMEYCDKKLKSRVHAISNRRMTWPGNGGSKWNGFMPGEWIQSLSYWHMRMRC